MARPNIRQIEAFNAVMKAGSATLAAEALFISQPAVSKLIQAFERACAFPLFTRANGRLTPTAEARQLFAETEKLEAGVVRVAESARAIRELARGEISIVAFPAMSMKLVPTVVAAFLAERPELRVSLLTRTSRRIEDSMIMRAADVGLSLVPARHPALRCASFVDIPMVAALPRGCALAADAAIAPQKLAAERFIALGREDQSFPIIAEAFIRAGAALAPAAEVQMADAACVMVGEGYGVSIVPSLVAATPTHPNVVFRPLTEPLHMKTWVTTSAFDEPSRATVALVEAIREAVLALNARMLNVPIQVTTAGGAEARQSAR